MNNTINLTNNFLIAMPSLNDPNFSQSVIYICEHNEYGAIGIVINRPTTITLSEVLDQMGIEHTNPIADSFPLLYGGPIHQERGFIIHRPVNTWLSSFSPAEGIAITTSKDILQAIAENKGPEKSLISLGYASWGAGQIEQELMQNSWLNCEAKESIIFDTPFNQRWPKAASLLGIDIHTISGNIGHA